MGPARRSAAETAAGRADEALPPLAAVYQTYSEGFATRDLQAARELLDRLA